MHRHLLFVVVLASAIGCRHAVAPPLKFAPPVSLAGTAWTSAVDAQTGVSIALPPGWRMGVPRAFDPGAMANGGMDATNPSPLDPELQKMEAGMQKEDAEAEQKTLARLREKEGIVLHCVDGSKPIVAEEPTRIYVKYLPEAGYTSLDEATLAEKQDTHREANSESVELPVGRAVRLVAKGQNRIGDVECHVSYVFLDGPGAYVLRFASTNNPDAILTIDRQVAQTFRVARRK